MRTRLLNFARVVEKESFATPIYGQRSIENPEEIEPENISCNITIHSTFYEVLSSSHLRKLPVNSDSLLWWREGYGRNNDEKTKEKHKITWRNIGRNCECLSCHSVKNEEGDSCGDDALIKCLEKTRFLRFINIACSVGSVLGILDFGFFDC